MGNPVVHFEVNGPDGSALEKFYGELFGWAMQPLPPEAGYTLVDTHGGAGINGGIGTSPDGSSSVRFYVEAADPQTLLDRAESLGGRTIVPVTEIPNMVTYALVADPDGLVVGIVKSATEGEQGSQRPSTGDGALVDWFEVIGSDAKRTQRFYTELFGWKLDDSSAPGYGLVDTCAGGLGIGGGLGAASEDMKWVTVYAHVPNVEAVLARAEDLGGGRVYGPNAVDDHMKTGAFRDPAGQVFGVYEHEHR